MGEPPTLQKFLTLQLKTLGGWAVGGLFLRGKKRLKVPFLTRRSSVAAFKASLGWLTGSSGRLLALRAKMAKMEFFHFSRFLTKSRKGPDFFRKKSGFCRFWCGLRPHPARFSGLRRSLRKRLRPNRRVYAVFGPNRPVGPIWASLRSAISESLQTPSHHPGSVRAFRKRWLVFVSTGCIFCAVFGWARFARRLLSFLWFLL